MPGLQEYKCPCCGGAIAFDSTLQKMKCPFCDTEFEMEALAAYDSELQQEQADDMTWETSAGTQWQDGETDGFKTYVCKSCGGEIVGDENTAATSCPFCGNPVVMMGQFAGALKPDYVIPFKLDKKAAKAALNRHYQGKRLLPKVFKDQNHIDEIKGIYVPFWLFDADAKASIRYKGTRVRAWSDSDYDYTETSYYSIVRGGDVGFERVPVDGSTKMADDLMESIEPFDFSGAVDFQTAYLAGYLADKYDVDAGQSIERANQRIKKSTEDTFAATVKGYTTVMPEFTNIRLQNGKAKYALYPVWLLNTTWQGHNYTFAMNGQTGKFVGDMPMDKGAFMRWLLGLWSITSVAVFVISCLMWLL
ncbi:MAG: hypothetical protein PUI46_07295 [Lachnospiraceae bacterium]|nr:hypothetical protein [Lachnospiraceae bacterium]MDY5700915.1 hypothetical protein [Lachnospiraceae bacterium]